MAHVYRNSGRWKSSRMRYRITCQKKKWDEYEMVVNRVRYEFAKLDAVKPVLYKAQRRQYDQPKKPKEILRHRGGFMTYHCPNCDTDFQKDERCAIKEEYCSACGKLLDSRFRNFCGNCGQAIENENLEEMENE